MDDAPKPAAPLTVVKLRVVPAMQGALWVRQGLRMFFLQPVSFAGLFGTMIFLFLVLMSIPIAGAFALVVGIPSTWLGFMRATQITLSGQSFGITTLFDTWINHPARRKTQIQLGLIYLSATFVLLLLGTLAAADASVWRDIVEGTDAARGLALQNPALLKEMLVRMVLSVPLSLLFWHAPALVQWAGQPIGKALFFSLMACWHNRWAFAVFGLMWFGVVSLALTFALAVTALLQAPQALPLALLPIAVIFGASFYASLYFSVVDCFEQTPASTEVV